ncbi:MAG: hypothetical protein GY757_32835, partial [bacterium]|nr:hypothetical protein [bacterium]
MYEKIILKSINSEESKKNIISDGKQRCTYGQIPGIFDRLSDYFAKREIPPEAGFIIKCGNSLPEAVLLLWMLYHKRDFLLLPRRTGVSEEQQKIEAAAHPEFLQYNITVKRETVPAEITEPEAYIEIEPNPNYKKDAPRQEKQGNIYLKTS